MEHVVLLSSSSVLRPDANSNPIALAHSVVEAALDDAGISRTFVRPGYFATNSLRWESVRSARVFRTAFPEATTSPVHERDIAAVAAKALLDDAPKSAAPGGARRGTAHSPPAGRRHRRSDRRPRPVRGGGRGSYRADLRTQLPAPVVDRLIEGHGTVPQLPADLGVDAVPELIGRPSPHLPRVVSRPRQRLPLGSRRALPRACDRLGTRARDPLFRWHRRSVAAGR